METTGRQQSQEQVAPVTVENILTYKYLGIEINGDFQPLIDQLNQALNTSLAPRGTAFHITLFSPPEMEKLRQRQSEKVAEVVKQLHQTEADLKSQGGLQVQGVGYIDGSKEPGIRNEDKNKKVAFVAVDIPGVQRLRSHLGLQTKDLHITLGYENGDIHERIVGEDGEGRAILAPIPKKENPELQRLNTFIPKNLHAGLITGPFAQAK